MKRLFHLQISQYKIYAICLVLISLSTGCAQHPWEVVGTATPTLQNTFTWDGKTIKQMSLQTNNNTRVRIFDDGRIQVNPTSVGGPVPCPILGGPVLLGQGQYASITIRAGCFSGLVSVTAHKTDWGQNIQSVVTRKNTVSYVVRWNGKDRSFFHGDGVLYANGAWFGSDRKLKEDIKPIDSALDKVLRMQGVTYRSRQENKGDEPNPVEFGLIAQEVEQVVPESVRTMNDGTKAVAYQNMVALLIEAIKEQHKEISALKQRLGIE